MNERQISELQAHLGFWLRAVSNSVSHAFARRVETEGVTVAEWVLLRSLYGSPDVSPTHLARAMGMTKGAISKLADRLVAKGMVLRTASTHDGRAHTLALTAAGRDMVPVLASLADANDAEFFGCLDLREREQLAGLLKSIATRRGLAVMPLN